MKFHNFLEKYATAPLINSSTFTLFDKQPRNLRRQARYWSKQGKLVCLKRGIYVFSSEYRKQEPSVLAIANFLVAPSYLSLEFALGFYGLIPEKVIVYTSATAKKTQNYKNFLGLFEYRSLKKSLFFGYKKATDNGQDYFIALPEKALLDYFYLKRNIKGSFDEFESLRLQNLDILDVKKLRAFSKNYNKTVRKITGSFIKFIESEAKRYKLIK